jgi:hypothetical protein
LLRIDLDFYYIFFFYLWAVFVFLLSFSLYDFVYFSYKQVPYTLNQPLRYSTTIFQRFGFSSSTPQKNDKEVNQPKDQETTAQEINAETSKEDRGSSGGKFGRLQSQSSERRI